MYNLQLARFGTIVYRGDFQWLNTAKNVARDNLHEYGADMAIITKPRGTKIYRTVENNDWRLVQA